MSFTPIAILPPKTYPSRLPTRWRGRGLRSIGFFIARSIGMLFGGFFLLNLWFFLMTLWAGLVYSYVNPPITSLMILRHIDYHYTIKPVHYLPLGKIPAYVPKLFVALENKTFYTDPGIDVNAMIAAWKANHRLGYIAYGASTITQQLTRSLFLDTSRTYTRKYFEILMSLTLNLVMSKDRQLELYLNYIEWGKGIYGIQTAALSYYGKPVGKLTPDQVMRLAAIIAAPVRYNIHDFLKNPELRHRYRFMQAYYRYDIRH